MAPAEGQPPVQWRVSEQPVDYETALAAMDRRVAAIAAGDAPEQVWLLQHPPLYTAGTSARPEELIDARFPVHQVGRGGQFTYHGPGQRVAYVMLDLNRRRPDVRAFVAALEEWIIRTLARFDVRGERRDDRIGVWVRRPDKGDGYEDKIAAIGIRVRKWVTLHGIALNVEPDLSHFSGIVPCGVSEQRYGVTSLADLGLPAGMAEVDVALRREFEALFGPTPSGIKRQTVGSTANRSLPRSANSSALPRVCRGRRRAAHRSPCGRPRWRPRRPGVARKHRLDRAVAAVAHPASDAGPRRHILDKGAKAHALDPAAKHQVAADSPELSDLARVGPSGRAERSLAASGCRMAANPIPAPPREPTRYSRASAALRRRAARNKPAPARGRLPRAPRASRPDRGRCRHSPKRRA